MGKSKSKKAKRVAPQDKTSVQADHVAETPSQVRAIDGHAASGWTQDEIKAYNNLLVQRQELEKQRIELEDKCAKSQAQRALLHENVANVDRMFKQLNPMSRFWTYVGCGECCVESGSSAECHHELCKRAKKEGILDAELDTIKRYAMRIHASKSDRICNALRKQRDLELIRVRKEYQEDQASNAKKSSKQARAALTDSQPSLDHGSKHIRDVTKAKKETEEVVNKIIHQLDDLHSDLRQGHIPADQSQGTSSVPDCHRAGSRDRSLATPRPSPRGDGMTANAHITATTELLQSSLRKRLLNANGDTFAQAFSIMNDFLSATKPNDLQDAIIELKDVLQLAGPMCDELQNSLGALEGIFDNPDRLAFTGSDGKQESSSSIIELMEKLKDSLKRFGQLPDGANASLTNVFQDCINLEEDAKSSMVKLATTYGEGPTTELYSALMKIKDEFVAKSPIPPLTSNKLESDASALLDTHVAAQLLEEARANADASTLEAQITVKVIKRAQQKSELYMDTLGRIEVACHQAGGDIYPSFMEQSFQTVRTKMSKFVPQQRSSGKDTSTREKNTAVTASTMTRRQEPQRVTQAVIRRDGKAGLLSNFQQFSQEGAFEVDLAMFGKAEQHKDQVIAVVKHESGGIRAALSRLYEAKLCPAISATIIVQCLWELLHDAGSDVIVYIKQLAGCIDAPFPTISAAWTDTFRHLALATIQLYVASYVESAASLPEIPSTYFAVFAMKIFTTFIQTTRTHTQAYNNLLVMVQFMHICFGRDPSNLHSSIDSAVFSYNYFCRLEKFKCMTSLACTHHTSFPRTIPFSTNDRWVDKPLQEVETKPHETQKSADTGNPSEHLTSTLPTREFMTIVRKDGSRVTTPKLETTICYNSVEKSERESISRTRERDIRTAENLKRAAALHQSTAKKALALLQLRANDYDDCNTSPPTKLLRIMDDLLNVAEPDYHHPIRKENIEPDATAIISRFAEHLDEPHAPNPISTSNALLFQNVFKRLRNGSLGNQYLNRFIDCIKANAMSGRHSSPIRAIDEFRNLFLRIGKIPDNFAQALTKAQNEIYNDLGEPELWHACETRRLKHLLVTVNASEPSVLALLRLAADKAPKFDEYHEIISDRLDETESAQADALEHLWDQITELVKAGKLEESSSPLVEFGKHAIEDWRERPRDITGYAAKPPRKVDSNLNQNGLGRLLAHEDSKFATITKGPAKLPKVEAGSPEASKTATHAPVLSPMYFTDLAGQQDMGDGMSTSVQDLAFEAKNDRKSLDRPKAANQLEAPIDVASATQSISLTDKEVTQPRTPSKQTDPEVSSHHLLPAQGIKDSEPPPGTSIPASTPPFSVRHRDVLKRVAALQTNCKDLAETAATVIKLDKTHDAMMVSIAEKLQRQVNSYREFATQLAEWNGVGTEVE